MLVIPSLPIPAYTVSIRSQTVPASKPLGSPSDAVLEKTLTEAVRLAEQAPEKQGERAEALAKAANAYLAADRPVEARRLYRAAVSAARRVNFRDLSLYRLITRGQVTVRDDAEAVKTAAFSPDSNLAREVFFLIARRDAPEDSPLRKGREAEAFYQWASFYTDEGRKYQAEMQKQMRVIFTASLDSPEEAPARRLGALSEVMTQEPAKREELARRYLPILAEAARN